MQLSFELKDEETTIKLVEEISAEYVRDNEGFYKRGTCSRILLENIFLSAIKSNFVKVITKFIQEKIVSLNIDNDKPIEWACRNGHADLVKLLLSDPNVDPCSKKNLIYIAALNNKLEVVQLLLADTRADPSMDDNKAITSLSNCNFLEVFSLLMSDNRVDPSARSSVSICNAATKGNTEIVKLLLSDKRVDPSTGTNYAIRYAALNGHTEVVELLLADPRVDPSDFQNEAIRSAAKFGHVEVVKLLIPRTDMSTIKMPEILKIAAEISESTEEKRVEHIVNLMRKSEISGIFYDTKGKITVLKNSEIVNIS